MCVARVCVVRGVCACVCVYVRVAVRVLESDRRVCMMRVCKLAHCVLVRACACACAVCACAVCGCVTRVCEYDLSVCEGECYTLKFPCNHAPPQLFCVRYTLRKS